MKVDATEGLTTQPLTLTQELILMLLNEETGYFHQVPGWHLNCAVVGAVLAELSLRSRIDTDMESLLLVDESETGNPALDPILKEIAAESVQRNAQYWIERLAPRAEAIIDSVLDRLVDLKILEYHDGEFWTLGPTAWHGKTSGKSEEGTAGQFIKTRISRVIFTDEIPDPRDVIIICLVNTCDVFRFIFQLDDEAEERIEFICKMDLIGRSLAAAVSQNLARPSPSTSCPYQEDSDGFAAQAAAEPAYSRRQPECALREPCGGVRSGVPGPSAVCETHGLHRRATDKPLGAQARAHVPESQGTTSAISRRSTARPASCPPWTAPIISGFASPCRRPILPGGWEGSWTKSTIRGASTWRA